ncbi:MAG: acyl-CoA thioesterase [Alphaproteobacteria bacterium]|nr:acyl-CoA thioesterase [Alphaproteobacteria bacterium]
MTRPVPPSRSDFAFFHPLRVRWSEVDPQGIVFNPNYLMYADVALTEFWRALGIDYVDMPKVHGVDTFMVNAQVDYFGSALFDDEIEIGVRTERLGRSSLVLSFAVFRGDEGLVSGTLTYVFATTGPERTPTPIPDDIRARLAGG